MPARNVVKHYSPGHYYHVYNRGHTDIFKDQKDYKYFISLLKESLDPITKLGSDTKVLMTDEIRVRPLASPGSDPVGSARSKNISDEVELVAYVLMPNHFHMMFRLNSKEGITKALRRILTSYSMHFNKKYKRMGSLFAGKPKAALIENEPHFLHLTRYIHQNPLHIHINKGSDPKNSRVGPLSTPPDTSMLREYEYSSYREYLGLRNTSWVKHTEILKFFRSPRKTHEGDMLSYESFVENPLTDSAEKLGRLILEKI